MHVKIPTVLAIAVLSSTIAYSQGITPIVFSGYSGNLVYIKDALRYGDLFKTSRFFTGNGMYTGGALEFGHGFIFESGVKYFEGSGSKNVDTYNDFRWRLKALQVPLNLGVLVRDRDKKFNIVFGSGILYTHADLKQYNVNRADPRYRMLMNHAVVNRAAVNFTYEMRLQVRENLQLKSVFGLAAIGNFSASINFLVQYSFNKKPPPTIQPKNVP